MNNIKTILYLKKFQEHSIDTFKLLSNDSVNTLFLVNHNFKNILKERLELWIGNFNWFQKEFNDNEFYNEIENFYKNVINSIHKILLNNPNFQFLMNNNIIECDDNIDSFYENNLLMIKKEYGNILGKSLKLNDIIEEKQSEINHTNIEIDNEKDKLKRLSTKEKFQRIKKESFYKDTIKKFIKLHIIIRNKDFKKRETERITKFFLHGYNDFFDLDINLATMSSEFKNEFFNKVDNKGFAWAIRIWVAIVCVPLLILCILMIVLIPGTSIIPK